MKTFSLQLITRKGRPYMEYRLYFPADQGRIHLNTEVASKWWDAKTGTLSQSAPNYFEFLQSITEQRQEIMSNLKGIADNNLPYTRDNYHLIAEGRVMKFNSENNFISWAAREIEESQRLNETTKRHNRTTINMLSVVMPNLTFGMLDYSVSDRWDNFLRKKYTNTNTIARHHKTFRKLVKLAADKRLVSYENQRSFNSFKIPGYTSTRKPLEEITLKSLEDLQYEEGNRLKVPRDAFLFSCYTGLRISDVTSITPDNFLIRDGQMRLVKIMYKLRKQAREVDLPLDLLFNGKARALITPYLEAVDMDEDPRLFKISEQEINRMLKVIAIDLEVKPFSFHYSRHTFLTNLAAKTGDVFTVMRYGGIANIATAQNYIKVAQKMSDEKLKAVKW